MPINICLGCGNEFPARTKISKHCDGHCFREKERKEQRARTAKYSAERRRAYIIVERAIIKGRLVRQRCEICNGPRAVAHHDDYAAPLDVRWLCISHHRKHHHQFGPGRNA